MHGGAAVPARPASRAGVYPGQTTVPGYFSDPVSAPVVISVRRARPDDLDFLVDLVNHEDVQPFLAGRAGLGRDAIAAEIERSQGDPTSYGRFVIEVDGAPAGV